MTEFISTEGDTTMKIGFIGTGAMGQPMARNLLEEDHELSVFNRTRSKAEELEDHGGRVVGSPAEAAENASVVVTMVSDDDAMTDVVFGSEVGMIDVGDGLIETLGEDAVHLASSTISPDLSRDLFKAHDDRNQDYVAGPVFGKPTFAEEATLSVVSAGHDQAVERCVPIFEAIGRQYFQIGTEPFKANIVKLIGNFTIASMMETLGESFALMQKSGIDPNEFLDVINSSLFDSPLYEAYGETIANGNYETAGFRFDLGLKDMGLARKVAEDNEAPMPMLSLIHDHFLSGVAKDMNDMDWAGLGQLAEERAGINS
jgi:3-hydroxyisobutyrate dehydrogenase-like beta-hydroxyacid dehydrogenase